MSNKKKHNKMNELNNKPIKELNISDAEEQDIDIPSIHQQQPQAIDIGSRVYFKFGEVWTFDLSSTYESTSMLVDSIIRLKKEMSKGNNKVKTNYT